MKRNVSDILRVVAPCTSSIGTRRAGLFQGICPAFNCIHLQPSGERKFHSPGQAAWHHPFRGTLLCVYCAVCSRRQGISGRTGIFRESGLVFPESAQCGTWRLLCYSPLIHCLSTPPGYGVSGMNVAFLDQLTWWDYLGFEWLLVESGF